MSAYHNGFPQRFSRRKLLQGGSTAALGLAAAGLAACSSPAPAPVVATPAPSRLRLGPGPAAQQAPPPAATFSEWARQARLASATFEPTMPESELQGVVGRYKNQNVTVLVLDLGLSEWMSDDEFAEAMQLADRYSRSVRRQGLRAVWRYSALETVSPPGKRPWPSESHPDWMQIALDGRKNVFHHDQLAWVEPDSERAWMSPNGPWREMYVERVKRLAQTGANGVWPDMPVYYSGVAPWSDTSTYAKGAFKQATGFDVPTEESWKNPVWRRWVEWRHRNLAQFLLDVAAAGRSGDSEFETFVQTVTCDFDDATTWGLDGAYLRLADGITTVWEVAPLSETDGMLHAAPDDWISVISMMKYARGATGKKPAWVYTQGVTALDASAVMAEALAAGCNPYEFKVSDQLRSADEPMRTRMYGFVQANVDRIYSAESLATVAVYHSSASRDFADPTEGTGQYATTTRPAGVRDWWSTEATDSCYAKQWLGEFRGTVKALVHAHVPFNVVTSPGLRPEDLSGYKLLLLPDLEAVADSEAAAIRQFVQGGGTIVITGANPTGMNEFGDSRPEFALSDVLGITRDARPQQLRPNSFGSGTAYYLPELPGRRYLVGNAGDAYEALVALVRQHAQAPVTVEAERQVHVEAGRLDKDVVVQLTNFIGVTGGAMSVVPTTARVSVQLPAGARLKGVSLSSPDNPTPEPQPLDATASGNAVSFAVPLQQYALVVVSTE